MLVERRRCIRKRSSNMGVTFSVEEVIWARLIDRRRFFQLEKRVGVDAEDPREEEGQREARNVSLPLDRVDALPGDPDRVRQLLLRPTVTLTQLLHPVEYVHCKADFTLTPTVMSSRLYTPAAMRS